MIPAILSMFRFFIMDFFTVKKTILILIFLLLGPVITLCLTTKELDKNGLYEIFFNINFFYVLKFQTVIFAILLISVPLTIQLEEGSIHYIFSSIIPKWGINLIRFLSAFVVSSVLIFISQVLMLILCCINNADYFSVGKNHLINFWFISLFVVSCYISFVQFVSMLIPKPVLVSIGLIFLWEFIVGMFPTEIFGIGNYTVINNAYALVLHNITGGERIFGLAIFYVEAYEFFSKGQAIVFFIVVITLFLAGSSICTMLRMYEPRRARV